jgi:hypothetical protein
MLRAPAWGLTDPSSIYLCWQVVGRIRWPWPPGYRFESRAASGTDPRNDADSRTGQVSISRLREAGASFPRLRYQRNARSMRPSQLNGELWYPCVSSSIRPATDTTQMLINAWFLVDLTGVLSFHGRPCVSSSIRPATDTTQMLINAWFLVDVRCRLFTFHVFPHHRKALNPPQQEASHPFFRS